MYGKKQTSSASIKDAFVDSARRQVAEAGAVAADAATSGAWAYPLLGAYYLLTHPTLLRPLVPVIFKGVVLSLGVLAFLFAFTYLPQVAVLAFISGPLAFVAAVPLILAEAYVVITFLARTYLLGSVGVDVFDAVLLQKGQIALVERGRQVSAADGKPRVLGRLLTKPLSKFSTDGIVRYILTLPLNFIPVVGTASFLLLNGYKAGPAFHQRYFQLKGYDKDKRAAVVHKRRGAYTAFGVVATLLGLVPVISTFFSLASSVGAALWAANIETKGNALNDSDVPVALPSSAKKEL
ncbi:hypothetical protein Q5752_003126 [Cryptotrichosporon argae]